MTDTAAVPQERPTFDSLFGDIGSRASTAKEKLVTARQEKLDADTKIMGESERRMEGDRGRMEAAYRAEGVGPNQLEPWDADKQRERYSTSPLEAFGSFGSVFAILASAFTKQPLVNALSGSAAAMEAIKKNDQKAYDQAYGAWQKNMDLVKTRFDMQHTLYNDAINLMNTDQRAGQIKLQHAMTRFDDKTGLAMLEAGMDKGWLDSWQAQIRSMKELEDLRTKVNEGSMRDHIFNSLESSNKDKNPQQTLQNFNYAHGVVKPWQQQMMTDYMVQNQDKPDEEKREGALELARKMRDADTRMSMNSQEARWIDEEAKRLVASGMEEGAARLQAMRQYVEAAAKPGGGNTALTNDRRIQADVEKKRQQWRAEHKSDDEIAELSARETARLKGLSTPITSNRADDLRSLTTRAVISEKIIDDVEGMLKKYGALTGLGGKLTRPLEVAGNWMQSNETDRKQFETYINELKMLGTRLLTEFKSRPLSAEESQISSIVPGLSMGDTTQHTAEQLLKLQQLFRTLRADWASRIQNEPFQPSPNGTPAPAPTQNWDAFPVVAPP